METNGKPTAPFQQWQNFYPPYAFEPKDNDYMALAAINNTERNLTAAHAGITKDIHQTTLGLRDAIEKGNYATGHSIERNTGLVTSAIERNGGQNMSITERNGGQVMTAIEKVAGENRLTTTISSAANRQAAADSARDLAISIERNGANTQNATTLASGTLLASIERNAGESRIATVTAQGFLDTKIAESRASIVASLNATGAELHSETVRGTNLISGAVNDSAWETRQALSAGFANTIIGQEKNKSEMLKQTSDYYSGILLEHQKMGTFLSSKSDSHFAMTQMEILKSKSELSSQSAQQFAINQLEQQKLGSVIAAQMAEAKYDALKNTQELGKQIAECCCELKEKNDSLDRERLRDGLNSANVDNNMLKLLEQARQGSGPLGNGILGGYGYPGVGLGGLGPNVGGYSEGYGNVHVYPDDHRRGRGRGRGSRRSHSRSRSPC